MKFKLIIFSMFLLSGCFADETTEISTQKTIALDNRSGVVNEQNQVANRWYTYSQIAQGRRVFQNNCATCHGQQAQGTLNWRKPLADGSYPPPPLDGSAHAWHHSLRALKQTIHQGNIALGGKMPAFKEVLTDAEIEAAIAYFQSKWNAEIYQVWANRVNQ